MNDDELKRLWRQQELSSPLQVPDPELMARMKKKMRKFARNIFWRDSREIVACVAGFLGYLYFYLQPYSALSRIGCLVVMLSCVFIAGVLLYSRRKHPSLPETAPLEDFLRAELAKVKWQAKLLKSVLWWYLLPIFIGIELFDLGKPGDMQDRVVVLMVNLFVFGVIYWVNLYAVRKGLLPLIRELEETLRSVENLSSPTDPHNPDP